MSNQTFGTAAVVSGSVVIAALWLRHLRHAKASCAKHSGIPSTLARFTQTTRLHGNSPSFCVMNP